jgi:hypothetical protein
LQDKLKKFGEGTKKVWRKGIARDHPGKRWDIAEPWLVSGHLSLTAGRSPNNRSCKTYKEKIIL